MNLLPHFPARRFDSRPRAAALAAAAAVLLAAGGGAPPPDEPIDAPDLNLPEIPGGAPFSLRDALQTDADGQGRVMLVDLWATWCVPCVAELPHLQELSTSLPDDDFLMVGIVLESGDAEDVAPFLTEHGLTYPNVMGSDEARDSFGPFLGYPTKYLIDQNGKVIKRYFGAVGEVLNEEIDRLLETGTLD